MIIIPIPIVFTILFPNTHVIYDTRNCMLLRHSLSYFSGILKNRVFRNTVQWHSIAFVITNWTNNNSFLKLPAGNIPARRTYADGNSMLFLGIQSFVPGTSDRLRRGTNAYFIKRKYKLEFNHDLKLLLDGYSNSSKKQIKKQLCQNIPTRFNEAQKYFFTQLYKH